MPELKQSIPPDLDLFPASEALRRRLYDAAVQVAFVQAEAGQPEELPGYSPEQAGFTVFYVWGRWFAVWFDLDSDETDLPPAIRWQVVRIHADLERPEGIRFAGI